MSVKIPYINGEKVFHIDAYNLLNHLTPKLPSRPTRQHEAQNLHAALQNPEGSGRITDLVGQGDTVALLVDDWTRPTPADKIVPTVIDEILATGVHATDITIIMACGTHQPLSRQQMDEKLGTPITETFRVQNHDPLRDLTYVGESQAGTPVYLNTDFLEADFTIAVGGICAHPVAGYGGGAKIIVPGIAGRETINTNHARAEDTSVGIGQVEHNPIRQDMEDIARLAGLDFIVNVILNPQREVIGVVAGDVVKAHRTGIAQYNQIYGAEPHEAADLVVLGAHPRNATIYHGTFALPCAVPFLKDQGTIIWVAPCLTGPGTTEYRNAYRTMLTVPPDQLLTQIKDGRVPASGGVFDWCTSKVVHRNRVVLVSDNLSEQETTEFGFEFGASIQQVLNTELTQNTAAQITVIPVGGLAVPIWSEERRDS